MITKITYKTINKIHKFPAETIYSFDGLLQAVTDGFALDLCALDDRPRKSNLNLEVVHKILSDVKLATDVLSEPKYIDDSDPPHYIVFNCDRKPVGIQQKYYDYFVKQYPGCNFVQNGTLLPIGVRYQGQVVGVVMPVVNSNAAWYE